MKLTTALLPFSLLLVGAAAFTAVSPFAFEDYTTLPVDPPTRLAQLSKNAVSLSDAISTAEGATQGRVDSLSVSKDGKSYTFNVFSIDSRAVVTINSGTGEVTSNESLSRFPGRAVSGDWTEAASGLKFYDITVGEGASPAGPSASVTVHYSGWLVDGTQFDSSVERGEPISFALNRVIPGWTEGVQSMKVGGVRKLIIPYDLGYGERGSRSIPPKATLIFDIELISL